MKDRIRVLRAERRMTQKELAKAAGVDIHTLYRWENGFIENARLGTLVKIADALGVEVAELYER